MTHMLTARISFVNSIMFVDGVREMVSFELGKEIEKDLFCLFTSVGQRKIQSSYEESNLTAAVIDLVRHKVSVVQW